MNQNGDHPGKVLYFNCPGNKTYVYRHKLYNSYNKKLLFVCIQLDSTPTSQETGVLVDNTLHLPDAMP